MEHVQILLVLFLWEMNRKKGRKDPFNESVCDFRERKKEGGERRGESQVGKQKVQKTGWQFL